MDKYFDMEIKVCRAVFSIFGLWPRLGRPFDCAIFLRFSILLVTMIGFCNVPQTIKLFESIGNFDEVLEIITNCDITVMMTVAKTLNLWLKREELGELLASMIEDWRVVKIETERLIMQRSAKLSHLTSVIIFWICESAVATFLMLSSYNVIKESRAFRENANATDVRIRPLYILSKFPYNAQKTPYYEITWFCQFLSMLFAASIFAAIDALFAALVLHICGQMKVLREKLKNLLVSSTSAEEKRANYLDLSAIVERHKELLWFAETVEQIFNVQLLVQLLSSLLIFCLTGYQIVLIVTKDVIPVLEILFAAYYYLSFSGSLFLYCLIAATLNTESTRLRETAYNSHWYRLSPSNVKLLIVIMIRTSQPIEITAGKFVPFSLQLYCSVLKTSGGYLSMLLAIRNRLVDN